MAHYDVTIIVAQSNGQGVLPKANAPAGVFTGNLLTGVKVWNNTAIVDFDCTDIGPSGNGHTYVGVGSSSSGNYAWPHLVIQDRVSKGENPLILAVTEGGSCNSLKTLLNGSHNTDVATLAATYPTTPILHTALVDRYNALAAFISGGGHTMTVRRAIIDGWEADADTLAAQLTDMTNKLAAIRTLVGNANLPIYFVTRASSSFHRIYSDRVFLQLAADNANNHCMKGYNLTLFDGAHFDAASMLTIRDWVIHEIDGTQPGTTNILNVPSITGTDYNILSKAISEIGITEPDKAEGLEYYITNMESASLINKKASLSNRRAVFFMAGTYPNKNIMNPFFRQLTYGGTSIVVGGLNFDGVNDQAETGFRLQDIATMLSSDFCISFYINQDSLSVGNQTLASWNELASGAQGILGRFYAPFNSQLRMDIGSASFNLASSNLVDNTGMFSFGVKTGSARIYKNGRLFGVKAYVANEFINSPVVLGVDIPGGTNRWLDNVMPYFSYGLGMTDAQRVTHYNIVQSALTIMGRQNNGNMPVPVFQNVVDYANSNSIPLPSQTVLDALSVYMTTTAQIIRREVTRYMAANGGSAEEFANINIINPETHFMLWPAGKTYNANGWTLNGTTQYGDPDINPSTQGIERYILNLASRKYWIHTVGGTVCDGAITTSNRNNLTLSNSTAQRINSGSTALNSAADMSGSGLKIISRNDETNVVLYNAGVKYARTQAAAVLLNEKQVIGKSGTSFGSSTYGSASPAGDSITDDEAATLLAAEQVYRASIGL